MLRLSNFNTRRVAVAVCIFGRFEGALFTHPFSLSAMKSVYKYVYIYIYLCILMAYCNVAYDVYLRPKLFPNLSVRPSLTRGCLYGRGLYDVQGVTPLVAITVSYDQPLFRYIESNVRALMCLVSLIARHANLAQATSRGRSGRGGTATFQGLRMDV